MLISQLILVYDHIKGLHILGGVILFGINKCSLMTVATNPKLSLVKATRIILFGIRLCFKYKTINTNPLSTLVLVACNLAQCERFLTELLSAVHHHDHDF